MLLPVKLPTLVQHEYTIQISRNRTRVTGAQLFRLPCHTFRLLHSEILASFKGQLGLRFLFYSFSIRWTIACLRLIKKPDFSFQSAEYFAVLKIWTHYSCTYKFPKGRTCKEYVHMVGGVDWHLPNRKVTFLHSAFFLVDAASFSVLRQKKTSKSWLDCPENILSVSWVHHIQWEQGNHNSRSEWFYIKNCLSFVLQILTPTPPPLSMITMKFQIK